MTKHNGTLSSSLMIYPNLADDGESSCALSVESHVLSVRLSQADVVAIVQELAHGESVTVNVTYR
jgi:hypothetical protein